MGFFEKITSKNLWLNLLGMLASVVIFGLLIGLFTTIYTRHGEVIEVPNMVKHNISDMEKICDDLGLKIEVTDSIYDPRYPDGYIIEQTPLGGSKVKEGRVIYIKMITLQAPTLIVPDIVDNRSAREAVEVLKTMKFRLGEVEYVPGEKDWVVGMKCNGRQLKKGDKVTINDIVILQVGQGSEDLEEIEEQQFGEPVFEESGESGESYPGEEF